MSVEITVWLVTPDAASRFAPDRQPAAEQERWRRLQSPRRRAEWAVSRAFLQSPALPADAATTLSHSAGHAAVAVGPAGLALGVDLERLKPRDFPALATLCCAPAERSLLDGLPDAGRALCFYALWTLKEAAIKAGGLDFPGQLAACEFSPQGEGWQARLPAGGPVTAAAWQPRPGLVLAALAAAPGVDWRLREWPADRPARWPRLNPAAIRAAGR